MSRYLAHAIGRRQRGVTGVGLRGHPLRWISGATIGLWATEWPGDATLSRDVAFAHHKLVAAICDQGPSLPVRFGTWLVSEDVARRSVQEGEARFAAAVERLGDRREIAVTLLWQEGAGPAEPAAAVGIAPGGVEAAPEGNPGRAFLDRKRTDHAATDSRRGTAEVLAERLRSELAIEQADVRHETCPSVEVALSLSLLARRDQAGALKARATAAVATLPGVRGVVSGPWPPYSFTEDLVIAGG